MQRVVKPLALLLCAGALGCNKGYERKVGAQEMPEAVQQAFRSAYPEAEVRGSKESEKNGKKSYEISFTHAGKKIDATFAADGRIVEVEEAIELAMLPAAAQTELASNFKDAAIKGAEHVRRGERVIYEVKVDVPENGSSKRFELVFDADGKLLRKDFEKENK